MTTLTYIYADSTAVLGPLARQSEPHSYDLCENHATRLTVPRGWEIIRLEMPADKPSQADDLVALADAMRAAPALREPAPREAAPWESAHGESAPAAAPEPPQRAHLRILPNPTDH